MKKLFVAGILMLVGYGPAAQAFDLGFQAGLNGSYAVIGHFVMDKKLSIRAFYNAATPSNVAVSSVGAAVEYRFQPNIYGALGLQQINVASPVSGWTAGVASYFAVGYTDKLDGNWNWHGEFNNFSQLVVGVTYRF